MSTLGRSQKTNVTNIRTFVAAIRAPVSLLTWKPCQNAPLAPVVPVRNKLVSSANIHQLRIRQAKPRKTGDNSPLEPG